MFTFCSMVNLNMCVGAHARTRMHAVLYEKRINQPEKPMLAVQRTIIHLQSMCLSPSFIRILNNSIFPFTTYYFPYDGIFSIFVLLEKSRDITELLNKVKYGWLKFGYTWRKYLDLLQVNNSLVHCTKTFLHLNKTTQQKANHVNRVERILLLLPLYSQLFIRYLFTYLFMCVLHSCQ